MHRGILSHRVLAGIASQHSKHLQEHTKGLHPPFNVVYLLKMVGLAAIPGIVASLGSLGLSDGNIHLRVSRLSNARMKLKLTWVRHNRRETLGSINIAVIWLQIRLASPAL